MYVVKIFCDRKTGNTLLLERRKLSSKTWLKR